MASFSKEIKSNRLLQSIRYSRANTDGGETFTRVLDLNSQEVYSQQNLIPTASVPYSSSLQNNLIVTGSDGSTPIARYYNRLKATRSSTGDLSFFTISPVPVAAANPQVVNPDQLSNWISNKYIFPLLADTTDAESSPAGYTVVVSQGSTPASATTIGSTNYQFDYKTGVLQFINDGAFSGPNLYISGYVYIGRTLADNDTQGYSGSFSGSFQGNGAGLTNVPASGIVGLNLTQIADSTVSASVSTGGTSFQVVNTGTPIFTVNNQGGFNAKGSSTITGSLQITQNLVVQGTASINYLQSISGSAKIIGDAFIILNTDTPTERFAGIKVIDSGSIGQTGSFLYDSQTDLWLYDSTEAAEGYAAGFLAGAQSPNKENLLFPTQFSVVRGDGSHHIVDSNIYSTGSNITINKGTTGSLSGLEILGDLEVTGSVRITAGASGSFSGSFQGNGNGLTNIPASGIVGLNLTQIADGSVSASVSSTSTPFKVSNGGPSLFEVGGTGGITTYGTSSLKDIQVTGSALITQTLNVSNNANITGSVGISGSTTITGITRITGSTSVASPVSTAVTSSETTGNYVLLTSQSAWFYNHNAGVPRSNAWKSSLNGSYFNNFDHNTNVSEILRFMAGLLSASAPSPTPNTKTFANITEVLANDTNSTSNPFGFVPQNSTNSDIIYLVDKKWAATGSSIFNGLTIYTNPNYTIGYSSQAGSSTSISSSADPELFGLGALDDAVKVSGSISFAFEQANDAIVTTTSSSQGLIQLLGSAPESSAGAQKNKINTANPAVIPAAFQDGKFVNIFQSGLFNGGISFSSISSSGYYQISATVGLSSSLAPGYTNYSATEKIFWSEVVDGDFAQNTIAHTPVTTTLTATSRSLSGAPYLQTATWNYQDTASGVFNPLYHEGTPIFSLASTNGLATIGGTTSQLMSSGQISTTSLVFDSTAATQRSINTVPFETDIIKTSNTVTFDTTGGTSTNIGSTSISPTNFTVTATAYDRDGSPAQSGSTITFHQAGTFGQPASSGSMAYYGRAQGADGGTFTRSSAGSLVANFTGESYRLQINDNVLSGSYAGGSAWNTAFGLYNLGGSDLQIKPNYLVKPGDSYGYWITDPNPSQTYKYYAVGFTRDLSTNQPNITMTLAGNTSLVNWTATTNDSVAALIIPQSVLSTTATAAGIDPTSAATTTISSGDSRNPFGRNLNVLANSNAQKTNPFVVDFPTSPNAFPLNTSYRNFVLLIRYIGNPTPLTSVTFTITA